MEPFYRQMRKEHQILMTPEGPLGGKWNYDQENRKKWKGQIPVPTGFPVSNNLLEIYESIQSQSIQTIGSIDASQFNWPINKNQAQQILDYFCENLLPYFGDFQDAMHTQEKFLFHSRLSFALNSKIISPKEVVDQVLKTYYGQKEDKISLNQVEGFVRQILGWREYMRGIYWREMPGYAKKNALDNHGKLPDFYWTAETKMNCMHQSIKQSLEHSYAHHIQRLMVTGNYALLTQTHPDEVDKWYLGIYIDAIEWVEMPNTRGMSQFADGGLLATKPYVSSGNYIQKMGNYCESCQYNHKAGLLMVSKHIPQPRKALCASVKHAPDTTFAILLNFVWRLAQRSVTDTSIAGKTLKNSTETISFFTTLYQAFCPHRHHFRQRHQAGGMT
jgi:deoxyribodipyrimidine photolyase-related protein